VPSVGRLADRPLPVQRELFDIPADVAYFNVASLAPTLRSALVAGQDALARRSQPWLVRSSDWFAVPQVHWTDGSLVDLDAVARRSREVGAALVVDASQSAGAVPLDVATRAPDFLVTVGYKWLLGPFGLSYLYVAERHRDGRPLEQNWIVRAGADDFAGLVDYRDEYQPGARRFDVGARTAFELTPMAVAALEQLLAWGVADIAASLRQVTDPLAERVRERGMGVAAERGPHMLGIEVSGEARERILRALTDAKVHVGPRGRVLRVSPHLHTTDEDVDRLLGALDTA
jgi:selenocysteine lyase/cysteine desulfurase